MRRDGIYRVGDFWLISIVLMKDGPVGKAVGREPGG
jgi:hypothetical protein